MKNSDNKQSLNYLATQIIIKTRGLQFHHAASRRGYCRAADVNKCEEYNGKFGSGVIVLKGRFHGSNNFTSVEYWTK